MRKIIRKILLILDGAPENVGDENRERGQSLMEMTAITPLLIILIVGMVEIGWFANNYLTLLEVTRVGARRGATLTGEFGPLFWDNDASLLPVSSTGGTIIDPEDGSIDATERARREAARNNARNCSLVGTDSPNPAVNPYPVGFYNLILCQMLRSMLPLEIKNFPINAADDPADRTDDIIISAFAIQVINNSDPATCAAISNLDDQRLCWERTYNLGDGLTAENPIAEYRTGIYTPVVVGRYPSNANECNQWVNPAVGGALFTSGDYERDPFDYTKDGIDNTNIPILAPTSGGGTIQVSAYPLELAFQTDIDTSGIFPIPIYSSQGFDTTDEFQRGWSYTGFHRAEFSDEQARSLRRSADLPGRRRRHIRR